MTDGMPTGFTVLSQVNDSLHRVAVHPSFKTEVDSPALIGLGTLNCDFPSLNPTFQVAFKRSP